MTKKRISLGDQSIIQTLKDEMDGVKRGLKFSPHARAVTLARILRRTAWSPSARYILRLAFEAMLRRCGGAKSKRFSSRDRAELYGARDDALSLASNGDGGESLTHGAGV